MAPVARRAPRENRTRWVALGMLAASPMTGYRLRQAIAGSVGHFWQESFGQLYPTLQRLAAEGLIEGQATRGRPGHAGVTYRATPRGRAALAAWLSRPPTLVPQRNEVLLKVFFAGAVPPQVTARNLEGVAAQLRAELDALRAIARRLDAGDGERHPDAPYWRLTLEFGLDFLGVALAWIDKTQRVLARRVPPPARGPGSARARAARRPAPGLPRRAR